MTRRKKSLKTWQKWLIGSVSAIVLVVSIIVGVIYYKIRSIDVADIVQRHQDPAVAANSIENLSDTKDPKLPSILSSPVDKAAEFASKPIKTQDALDVAALLLKSGLSLKEVYYLTGEAKSDMSTEEKQKIRDLLLSKLTDDEIKALRAITKQYGKGLLILDPNYPIELIGIDDPQERKRVEQELKDKKQTKPESKPAEPATKEQVSSEKPVTGNDQTKSTDSAVAAGFKSKLDALGVSCQGDIHNLIDGVVSAKKANSTLTLSSLQSMFMGKFTSAEASCDTSFKGIVSEAEQAGVSATEINTWKQTYNSMKQTAQSSAINQLSQLLLNKQ
ncbi:hypothetical protein A8709_23015 [Paenibacillus pectinilyticus]|uniref:Uncharacterized protein n=1 Tax=Paenibacillus pectinilyticus TaxID=512399 RepID=A0A1C0ZRQ6_9BACL|nr:hypothetical protein [Paenibacillus pectinilyticus]OCT10711.1 hypothetical protein A8709_23015 [Paenibacillus pectinilyticus]